MTTIAIKFGQYISVTIALFPGPTTGNGVSVTIGVSCWMARELGHSQDSGNSWFLQCVWATVQLMAVSKGSTNYVSLCVVAHLETELDHPMMITTHVCGYVI